MDLEMLYQSLSGVQARTPPRVSGPESLLWDEGSKVVDKSSWPFGLSTPPESPVDPLSDIWAELQTPAEDLNTGQEDAFDLNWLETPVDFQYLLNGLVPEGQTATPTDSFIGDIEQEKNKETADDENWLQSFSPVSVEELESILSSEPGSPDDLSDCTNTGTIDLLDFVDSPPVDLTDNITNTNTALPLYSSDVQLVNSEVHRPLETIDNVALNIESDTDCIPSRLEDMDVCVQQHTITPRSRRKKSEETSSSSVQSGRVTKNNKRQEKKLRKMQQNKDAATRYRVKKKAEKSGTQGELELLESRNTELKQKVDSLSTEIKYLKDLMAEVYKAKSKSPKKKKVPTATLR